jgi:hypothetical protein
VGSEQRPCLVDFGDRSDGVTMHRRVGLKFTLLYTLVLICDSVLQFLIAVLAFWGGGKATRVDRGLNVGDLPPVYIEHGNSPEADGESVVSYEQSMKAEKKGKSAESYH